MAYAIHVEPLAAPPPDPLRLFALPEARDHEVRCAWFAPDGSVEVGVGSVCGPAGRPYGSLQQMREQGFVSDDQDGHEMPIAPGVRHFLGHAFDPVGDVAMQGLWCGFHRSRLSLPEIALSARDGRAWLTLVVPGDEPSRVTALAPRARELAAGLAEPSASAGGAARHPRTGAVALAPSEAAALRGQVEAALAAIQAGEVQKVVVATSHTVRAHKPLDPVRVLRRLIVTQPGSFHYLVQPRRDRALVGASPERLVAVDGDRVRTMALAGSAPRGVDPAADEALGAALLASAKDRAEHQLVVDAIRAALEPVATSLTVPAAPRLRKLATIQHLETPIEATLPGQGDILDLAARLHPTPALAGTPREAALALIRRIEGDTRGWYGGLVGWVDAAGNGDLTVAIRCLLLAGDTATAFAGAGIVAGSDPDREMAEITLKLGAALGAVG